MITKPFLGLVNKFKPYSCNASHVIKLFDHKSDSRFESFLTDSRVRPLIIMHLLFNFLKTDFVIGHETRTFYYKYADETPNPPKEIVLKESVVNKQFSGEDLFNLLLSRIGLMQLNIPFVAFEGEEKLSEDVVPSKVDETWYEEVGEEVFFSLDGSLIIYPDKILVSDDWKEKVETIISCYYDPFNEFLESSKSLPSIDHKLYVEWLVKWFPGMIHFKSLE